MANEGNSGERPGSNANISRQGDAFRMMSALDFLIAIGERKFLILAATVAGAVLAVILAFLTPPTYTAKSVIMPPQQSSSSAALLGQLSSFGGLTGQSQGIKNPSDPYVGILKSRTVADNLIKKFGLMEVYAEKDLAGARKRLSKSTRVDASTYSLIHISVEDRSPERAADLANAYVEQLQLQNSRLAVTESAQRRLFFEQQLTVEKELLAQAEFALKEMQEKGGVIQVDSQVEAMIDSMARIRAEIFSREVNMQRLKAGATVQNPLVQRQEVELKALRDQLRQLEESTSKQSKGDPFIPTSRMPAAGLEYARRLRDVRYHEALYEVLARQFEAARIDEAQEAPLIQVVDRAVPPERRSAPWRAMYLVLGVILGALLGVILALFLHAAEDPVRARKLAALKHSLRFSTKP